MVSQFCYLGCLLTRDCSDDADVQNRIDKAAGAFGSVRREIFSNQCICFGAKLLLFEGLILAILLYGSESWCLTEKLYNKLRLFHARCARAMCRVTRWHTWRHKISTDELLTRIGLRPIESYITRRQLQWAGHGMEDALRQIATQDAVMLGRFPSSKRVPAIYLWTWSVQVPEKSEH